jgi:serine/threonine-protein kinase
MTPKIGDAGYRILEPIASGGMGQVFRAEHVITKRIEAIKVLSGAGTEEETDRFLREIQLQASLSHPNIAAVYNAFRFEDDLVMVMELVEGEPLRAVLQRGALRCDSAVRYACELLDAIGYAHAHGVIHRDITPSNIVITPKGSIKLMDFGLAKAAASPSASQSGAYLGSPHYMSPEQVKDATRASTRSDIYSLGAVLYEMVTGRKVFEGDSSFIVMQAQVETVPTPPLQINPAIPPALNAAILTALEKDPARRFADAAAFRHALETPAPMVVRATPPKKSWRPAWLVPALQFGVTCAVILLPTAYYAHSRHPADRKQPAVALPATKVPPAAQAVPPGLAADPAATAVAPPATPSVHPFLRPSPKRVARRTPKPDLTPTVVGNEAPPPRVAAVPTAAPPAAPLRPTRETVAAVPQPSAPEPSTTATAPAETPTAEAAREEQPSATAKERKPHGRFRRALGKIFSPFSH